MLTIYLLFLGYCIVMTLACAIYCQKVANLKITAGKIYMRFSYASYARLIIYLGEIVLLIIFSKQILNFVLPFNLRFWIISVYFALEIAISTFALTAISKIYSNLTRIPDLSLDKHL